MSRTGFGLPTTRDGGKALQRSTKGAGFSIARSQPHAARARADLPTRVMRFDRTAFTEELMSALPALSVALNRAFDTRASSSQLGADSLARAPAPAETVSPQGVTHSIFGSAPGSDDWLLLQANREVTAQIMRLAARLQVPDVDRWATGVLASVDRRGAPDGAQMLRAAQMNALGTQLGTPTQPAALSVSEIRQLASARAQIQPTATAQESRATTGQRPTPPSVSPRLIRARTDWSQALPAHVDNSPAVNAFVSAKQNLQRQLRALGIQCDDPTTIRTGPGSQAVVGTTKGGVTFEIAIRSNGSLAPRSAAVAGGHTIATDPRAKPLTAMAGMPPNPRRKSLCS